MKPDLKVAQAVVDELGDAISLVSDTYAARCDIERDRDWSALKLSEETGELIAAHLKLTGRGRRAGVSEADLRTALEDEAADVFAQLIIFCRENGIDLMQALDRKWFRYLKD